MIECDYVARGMTEEELWRDDRAYSKYTCMKIEDITPHTFINNTSTFLKSTHNQELLF